MTIYHKALSTKGIIENDNNRYYLVAIIDSQSRIAWVELVPNITSLTVMFASLKMINSIACEYGIRFNEILTDNGAEFGSGPMAKNKGTNLF